MRNRKPIACSLFISFCLAYSSSFAQVKDSTGVKDSVSQGEKTHFIAGVTYNSTMNYYGRVDSLKSSGIYPFIGVSFKNGLYLHSTFVFVYNSLQSQYAATLAEGGYNFKNKQGTWAGNISASKYFYQGNTDLVQSAVKEVVAISFTQLNKVVNITLGADAKFSSSTDFGVQGGIDHIIRIPAVFGNDVIVLDPSANIFAGTQNFTQTYLEHMNLLFIPVSQQEVTKSSQQFNVLAYECSLPIVYGYKKFNLVISPAYILPQNIVMVANQPNLSERAKSLFYLTATVKFTL